MNKNCIKIGIGSFTFRYAIGIEDCMPNKPMTPIDFIDAASNLGFNRIQLCENLKYAEYNTDSIISFAERAKDRNLIVELGTYGLTYDNLKKHIEIANIFNSKFIRIAIGDLCDNNIDCSYRMAIETISSIIDECKKSNIVLGLENHFDLPTPYILKILEEINDPYIGAIYDTTNAIYFIERPERTLELLLPYIKSVHLKDYQLKKAEASIVMSGRILGEGQLNSKEILKTVLTANPEASVIMETTIRRREGLSSEQVVFEEKLQIEKSTQYLKDLIDSF